MGKFSLPFKARDKTIATVWVNFATIRSGMDIALVTTGNPKLERMEQRLAAQMQSAGRTGGQIP